MERLRRMELELIVKQLTIEERQRGSVVPIPEEEKKECNVGENFSDEETSTASDTNVIDSLLSEIASMNDRHFKSQRDNDDTLHQQILKTSVIEKQSQHEITSLKAERDGLLDIINAMTNTTDDGEREEGNAISFANKALMQDKPTLPLYVIQMMEAIPWDERARKHASFTEEVYEWQVYNKKRKKWSKELVDFPDSFRQSLPISKPTAANYNKCSEATNTIKRTISDDTSSPSSNDDERGGWGHGCAVFTDASISHILDLDSGFPLPQEGTWNWVGGWMVNNTMDHCTTLPSDAHQGWSYAEDIQHLISKNAARCYASPNAGSCSNVRKGEQPLVHNTFRMRRWKRLRVLLSYPSISTKAKQFLSIAAQNASLMVSISKLSDQLLDAQGKLAQEEEWVEVVKATQTQVEMLLRVLEEKEEIIKNFTLAMEENPHGGGGGGGKFGKKNRMQWSASMNSGKHSPSPLFTFFKNKHGQQQQAQLKQADYSKSVTVSNAHVNKNTQGTSMTQEAKIGDETDSTSSSSGTTTTPSSSITGVTSNNKHENDPTTNNATGGSFLWMNLGRKTNYTSSSGANISQKNNNNNIHYCSRGGGVTFPKSNLAMNDSIGKEIRISPSSSNSSLHLLEQSNLEELLLHDCCLSNNDIPISISCITSDDDDEDVKKVISAKITTMPSSQVVNAQDESIFTL